MKEEKELPKFEDYRFSVNTTVKYKGFSFSVVEVDFELEEIGVENPFDGNTEKIYYSDLEDIWEKM
jgi:hypothetical protein